jgi:hypothetical protein
MMHPKAFALLQNCQLLFLPIQLRVLYRNRGLRRKHFQNFLVLRGKYCRRGAIRREFIGHVQITDDAPLGANWHAKQGTHRRVIGRKTAGTRFVRNIGNANRFAFVNQNAE